MIMKIPMCLENHLFKKIVNILTANIIKYKISHHMLSKPNAFNAFECFVFTVWTILLKLQYNLYIQNLSAPNER